MFRKSLLTLLSCSLLASASPPVKIPQVSIPVQVTEVKQEPRLGPIEIAPGEVYVVELTDDKKPALLVSSPEGIVAIQQRKGPLTLHAKFVGGTDFETKEFKSSKVWIITAKSGGSAELLTWEVGTEEESGVYRFQVKSNIGPRPPPKPDPTPGPGPSPDPTPVPLAGFRVLLLQETSANMTKEQYNALSSTKVIDYLTKKTTQTQGKPGWRKWDPFPPKGDLDVSRELPIWQNLWASVKPVVTKDKLPLLVVAVDQKAQYFPIISEADLLATLQRFGGP